MFEPTVFARQREIVMGEEFLGDNNRVLQGFNFNFGASMAPALQELRIGGFATRLRQADKERPNLTGGAPVQVSMSNNTMDRYAVAANTDLVFIPGTNLGGTFMYIGDAKRTNFRGDFDAWQNATNNMVFSARGGLGSELFSGIDPKVASFGLSAEFAGSNYAEWGTFDANQNRIDWTAANLPTGYAGDGVPTATIWNSLSASQKELFTPSQSATAFKGGLDGNFRFGANGLNLDLGFIANQRNFRNEMAQSPAMFNRGILHSSNQDHWENNPNTFDALYVSAFTYMPGEYMQGVGGTGTKQPMRKSAWTRSTLTSTELDMALDSLLIENLVSGAMHFGDATPNRTGLVADLGFDFLDRAVLVSGGLKMLQEMSGLRTETGTTISQEFMEFGGGLSLDIAKFGHWWAHPFILSGSFRQTAVDDFSNIKGATNDISFMNAGAYWQFWRRAALMGGYQFIRNDVMAMRDDAFTRRVDQSQWAAGFEFIIAEGGVLNATVGQVEVKHWANDPELWGNLLNNNGKALRIDLNLSVKF
jgi:hypothetical protein